MAILNKNSKLSKHPLSIGIIIYLVYLAIFYATWSINGVDYSSISKNEDTLRLWYALPTLIASLSTVIIISLLGWWRKVLFDAKKQPFSWTIILPIFMALIVLTNFSNTDTQNLTLGLIIWGLLGGIGVGFGEEVITRGSLLVGLRSKYSEGKVWLYSTILFSLLHAPNVIFGLDFNNMLIQLVLTFIMGTAFYAIRRICGNLIIPILLHGLWDSSLFIPIATGSQNPSLISIFIYPLALICSIPILKKVWKERI